MPLSIPEVVLQDGARLFVASLALTTLAQQVPRRNAFYTLAWLSGAPATLLCDGVRHEVPPGSLAFITPGQVHRWEAGPPGATVDLLGFLPDVFTGKLLDVRLVTDLPFFRADGPTVLTAPAETREALDVLFRQAERRYARLATREAQKPFMTLPRRAEALLLAYLHTILAEAAGIEVDASAPPASGADTRLARLFRFHAEGNVARRYGVAHYARALNVTPDHLTRVVRRVTGRTPSAWLQARLLLEARRLLTFTDQPIEGIAERLGFPTATQFSQWFRREAGQTPSDARRQRGATSDSQQS